MQLHHYHVIWLRLIVCFIASIDININGHWYLLKTAVVTPMFYVAFLVSFGICYMLLYFIHRLNQLLDNTHPWTVNWRSRVIRQFVFGLLVPALADLLFIVIYFLIAGRTNKLHDHIYYEYPRAVLFIVAINIVFGIISFVKPSGLAKVAADVLMIKHNGVDIKLHAGNDVLYVYKSGRNIKVMTISGSEYSKRDTISTFIKSYQQFGFCKVNPSAIVNLSMLKGSTKGTRSKTLEPLFKPQFQDKVSQSNLEKLRVTREYLPNFKKEMKKYMAGEVQI